MANLTGTMSRQIMKSMFMLVAIIAGAGGLIHS